MKVFLYTLGLLVVVSAGAFLWLTKPHMSYVSTRATDSPVQVEVEYVNVTGDALCSKLYQLVDDEATDKAVFPNVPDDIPDPHDVDDLADGDRLTIEGFPYEWSAINRVTGTTTTKATGMVDVIAWEGPDGLAFRSKLQADSGEIFDRRNYTDCR